MKLIECTAVCINKVGDLLVVGKSRKSGNGG